MSWSSGSWDAPGKGDDNLAEAVGQRRAEVRRAVIELVRTRRAVAEDQERLDGYLRDICPNQPAEVAVVVVAARSGVPEELARATEGHGVEAMAARLASRMHEESGVDRALARWAVDTWAVALGRLTDSLGSVPPEEAPVIRTPSVDPAPTPVSTDGEALRAMVARPAPAPSAATVAPPPAVEAEPAPAVDDTAPLPAAGVPPPQRTRSRPPPSDPPAPVAPAGPSRRRLPLVPIAAVAFVAVVALLVALTRGGDTPTATDATSVTTVPPTSVAPRPLPTDTAVLEAATYVTSTFQPAMRLVIRDPWKVVTPEKPELFEIGLGPGSMAFVHLTRVFRSGGTYRTFAEGAAAAEPVPADLSAWLTSNPNVSTTRPVSTTIAGASGSRVDLSVPSGYQTELCRGMSVPLWPFEDTKLSFGCLGPGDRHRVYALDVKGQKALIILSAAAEQFDAFARGAERLLADMSFT